MEVVPRVSLGGHVELSLPLLNQYRLRLWSPSLLAVSEVMSPVSDQARAALGAGLWDETHQCFKSQGRKLQDWNTEQCDWVTGPISWIGNTSFLLVNSL